MLQESENPKGTAVLVAWIEEKGAKQGARVELKGEEGLWYVQHVGACMDEKQLKANELANRRSLTSISG
jgi:hypothetical protein